MQAEDGIRDLVRSRGLGDVYKRQLQREHALAELHAEGHLRQRAVTAADGDQALRGARDQGVASEPCLLYTSDAADERSSVDLGGRRTIKKKQKKKKKNKRPPPPPLYTDNQHQS